jgi:hypothetical protein
MAELDLDTVDEAPPPAVAVGVVGEADVGGGGGAALEDAACVLVTPVGGEAGGGVTVAGGAVVFTFTLVGGALMGIV